MSTSGFSVEQDWQIQAYKHIRGQYLAAEKKRKEDVKQRKRAEKMAARNRNNASAEDVSAPRFSFTKMLKRVGRIDNRNQKHTGHGVAELVQDDRDSVDIDLKEACAMEVPREVL